MTGVDGKNGDGKYEKAQPLMQIVTGTDGTKRSWETTQWGIAEQSKNAWTDALDIARCYTECTKKMQAGSAAAAAERNTPITGYSSKWSPEAMTCGVVGSLPKNQQDNWCDPLLAGNRAYDGAGDTTTTCPNTCIDATTYDVPICTNKCIARKNPPSTRLP